MVNGRSDSVAVKHAISLMPAPPVPVPYMLSQQWMETMPQMQTMPTTTSNTPVVIRPPRTRRRLPRKKL
ncbi:hypothetical protein Y032_0563g3511 [Ancylostoma ceylanicum]|uniref:Uncharacterized protein n=1 Tax=Ancylostoma ceylanicum TaxID=53326 RepID=A0A016WP64_9BILA|nr:hypothetical protein Y032_0563g3511 [Ancylostoma ceylanicum]